jgi:hypothetical protein
MEAPVTWFILENTKMVSWRTTSPEQKPAPAILRTKMAAIEK